MTAIRFLLDEHVPLAVAPQLRRRGIDCITVGDAGRQGLSDDDHLRWAMLENRVIVSFDNDFLALARIGDPHAGIIRCTRHTREVGPIVRALLTFVSEHEGEDMAGGVWYI